MNSERSKVSTPFQSSANGTEPSRSIRLAPLILIAVIVLLAAVWQVISLLVLAFGAILTALLLDALAEKIEDWTGLGHLPSLSISVFFILTFICGFMGLLGQQIFTEMSALVRRTPEMISTAAQYFNITDVEEWVKNRLEDIMGQRSLMGDVTGLSAIIISVPLNIFLVVIGGIYFAADPKVYKQGFLKLLPAGRRDRISEIMSDVTVALRRWFLGQLLSMLCIGVLTTIGLMLLGISSPFALGFIAGVLEFIPYVGPVLSVVPAVVVAFGDGPWSALWVVLLYLGIQQAESALIVPLIQKRAVKLQPGLILFTILGFGILLGPSGMIFGAPLTVVFLILIQKLWIEDVIEKGQMSPSHKQPNRPEQK